MPITIDKAKIEKAAIEHFTPIAEERKITSFMPHVEDHLVTIGQLSPNGPEVFARYIWSGDEDNIKFTELTDNEIIETAWAYFSPLGDEDAFVDEKNLIQWSPDIPDLIRLVVGPSLQLRFNLI